MATKAILLVEDDADHRALTERALRAGDVLCALMSVRDGDEALDYVFCEGAWAGRDRAVRPALILLDLKMKRLDGIEVLRRLRADPRSKTLPIVVLTSSTEPSDLEKAYAAGASGFVRKPASFDDFAEALRSIASFWIDVNVPPPLR